MAAGQLAFRMAVPDLRWFHVTLFSKEFEVPERKPALALKGLKGKLEHWLQRKRPSSPHRSIEYEIISATADIGRRADDLPSPAGLSRLSTQGAGYSAAIWMISVRERDS
jgi:hypothetical protein